ncbi:MAG: hypothetical protein AAF625_10465 [Pseudomonadota bacterium]
MIRPIATFMMALTGAFFFFVFVAQDIRVLENPEIGALPWGLILRYALAMALGGAIAGFLFSGLFGRSGLGGWLLAVFAGVLATTIAGLFGSAIGELPELLSTGVTGATLIPIFAGLLVLPLSIADQPAMAGVLLIMVVVTHVLVRNRRRA